MPKAMKAVIPNSGGKPPCIVYWTGRVRLHVGVLTYCRDERDASDGVLQVPEDVECCTDCEKAVEGRDYPKTRS